MCCSRWRRRRSSRSRSSAPATLLLAGCSALTQNDIKRILAYSTISQIGYMFLALGVGAWAAAMFHFMTHAFFKALLFLAAGIVIEALHARAQYFPHGRASPRAAGCVLDISDRRVFAGRAAAGHRRIFQQGSDYLGRVELRRPAARAFGRQALVGVLLTALYTFRLIFVVFFGETHTPVTRRPGWAMVAPAVVLAVLSGASADTTAGGSWATLATRAAGAGRLRRAAGSRRRCPAPSPPLHFWPGCWAAWFVYLRQPAAGGGLCQSGGRALHEFWFADGASTGCMTERWCGRSSGLTLGQPARHC